MLDIRLKPSFRYVHEPLSAAEDVLPPLANEMLRAELQSRLLHSRGGTFLITGFRGVGKSTLVMRALDEIVAMRAPSDLVLPVLLSLARSTTTEQLLFAIVRRIFEALSDSGVLDRLSAEVRHALLIAYMRTSLSFKQSQSEALQRSAGVGIGAGSGKAAKAIVDFVVPTVSISAQHSQSLATEASFLAYSETDVEHDLMRIVSLVSRESTVATLQPSRLRRLWPWSRRQSSRLRLVVILDEVDKLTVGEAGVAAVEDLLTGIKNVLTTSGAHFLVVAGPDLHDRAVRDAARGNGVYESVFGWRMYVPCSWDAPDLLVADIVSPSTLADNEDLQVLVQYLRFKARGVLRRLLQEFNDFVAWDEGSPRLQINDTGMVRVKFYAQLETTLRKYFESNGQSRLFPVAIDEDRWRLGGYYVLDWVLQSRGEPFSALDLLREGEDASFDPLLRVSRRNVDHLLDHFAEHGILEVIRENNRWATIIADVPESRDKVYRLAEDVGHALFGFAVQHESERAARDVSLVGPRPAGGQEALDVAQPVLPLSEPVRVLGGRYELLNLIGQGGMGSVYAGQDQLTGQRVAVKVLRASLATDPQALARVRREAEIATQLMHPQLVRAYGTVQDADGSPALVMELLEGPTLKDVIDQQGPRRPAEVAVIGHALAEALTYLANKQIVRVDLKPANIIIHGERGPVVIDLGIARTPYDPSDTALTDTGQFVGTPMYMAPEVIAGGHVDGRADLFSLGLVLYYCLAGRNPWEDLPNTVSIMYAVVNTQVDVHGLPGSPEFLQILASTLANAPEERFPSAQLFRKALESTPEWSDPEATVIRRRPAILAGRRSSQTFLAESPEGP